MSVGLSSYYLLCVFLRFSTLLTQSVSMVLLIQSMLVITDDIQSDSQTTLNSSFPQNLATNLFKILLVCSQRQSTPFLFCLCSSLLSCNLCPCSSFSLKLPISPQTIIYNILRKHSISNPPPLPSLSPLIMHRQNEDHLSATILVLLPHLIVLIKFHLGEFDHVGLGLSTRQLVPLVDLLDQIPKGLIDVLSTQCTHCEKLTVVLGLQLINSFLASLQQLCQLNRSQQITLVPKQQFRDLIPAMQNQLLQPSLSIIQGFLIGEIEHHTGCLRQREVIVNDSSVTFLTS